MKIWILQEAEPYPFQEGVRIWRDGMLALELRRREHDVTWWGSIFAHKQRAFLSRRPLTMRDDNGIKYRLLHSFAYRKTFSVIRYLNYILISRQFLRKARELPPPALIIVNIPNYHFAYAGAVVANKTGSKLIVDCRDPWPDNFYSYSPRMLKPLVLLLSLIGKRKVRYAINSADVVVALSKEMNLWAINYLGELGPKPEMPVFHVGYPSLGEPPEVAEPDIVKLVFAGYLGTSIDYSLMVRIYQACDERMPGKFELHVVGDGEFGQEVKSEASKVDSIVFHGWLDKAALHSVLKTSDIGLALYRPGASQSMPNKPIEYFAYGLQVISSIRGELEGFIDEWGAGTTYNGNNFDCVINYLIDFAMWPPEKRSHAKVRAQKLHQEQFDPCQIYAEYADMIERVANG